MYIYIYIYIYILLLVERLKSACCDSEQWNHLLPETNTSR